MRFTQGQSQTSVAGLIANIVPNAATGSELVLQQGTVVLSVKIAEIVAIINQELKEDEEKKKNEALKSAEGTTTESLPTDGQETKSNTNVDGSSPFGSKPISG